MRLVMLRIESMCIIMQLNCQKFKQAGVVAMGIPGEDQWILTAEEYADLAAFKGTSLDEELESRRIAAEFIQKLGMRLKLYKL